ncbi:MAG: heparinase II/III family protein, partial [bacterium]|nr:heparinase II/III family protein [bacterium]
CAQDGGAPVYDRGERLKIERDLLLESTFLAACDNAINNKSVGNRAGAAIVGMCVGHPGLVHFGLDGFVKTVNDWFLPDGGTSESPAYAMMTMNGIRPFALAFREYSDPVGYTPPTGTRLDGFNACRDTLYGDCWQALVWTLQGNLQFPPSADSYASTAIGVPYADLLALAYPTDTHLALLKELVGRENADRGQQSAVFYRDPNFEAQETQPLALPDVVFPYLSQGYLRTGEHGRESLVLLNAADHANHHHLDGLGLYYWKDGRELLSDLGYLWDHPDKYQTARTGAHNLVMVDGKDQAGRGRHGSFHLFSSTPAIKVMEASSDGYGPESLYQRTVVQIDHGASRSYLLDIFRASCEQTADYIFHGPNANHDFVGLALEPVPTVSFGENGLDLTDLHAGSSLEPWRVAWTFDDDYTFEAFAPGSGHERVFVGDGWGQRDHRNTDVGATLPYIVRRVEGQGRPHTFVSVFVGRSGKQSLVHAVRVLQTHGHDGGVAVEVETAFGTDLIISQYPSSPVTLTTDRGEVATDGRIAALITPNASPPLGFLLGGSVLRSPDVVISAPHGILRGSVLAQASENGQAYFELDRDLTVSCAAQNQTLFTVDGTTRHGYPLRRIESTERGCRVFTKVNHEGFEARSATRWELAVATTGV